MTRLLSATVTWLTIVAACLSGLLLMALAQRPALADRSQVNRSPVGPHAAASQPADRLAALSLTCSAASSTSDDDPTVAGLEAPAALALSR